MMLDPVADFRTFDYLREAQENGQNHGQRVNGVQVWCGGKDGESWCCYLATLVLDRCFKGNAPIPRMGACEDVRQLAIKNDWIVDIAQALPGDLVLYLDANGHAHHIAMLTDPNADTPTGWNAIAGNTSATGESSNGDGCYEHALLHPAAGSLVVVQYPRG